MGILSNIKATKDIQRIKSGGTAKLSNAQIVNLIINLPDANKNLPKKQFDQVYALFRKFSADKTKKEMDFSGYIKSAEKIITQFNAIAPYDLYCGER